MTLKRCTKCELTKPLCDFPVGHNRCKSCQRLYMVEWANRNRANINANQLKYQTTITGRANLLLNGALNRAKKRGEEFKLIHADVIKGISSGYCCKTFLPFDMEMRARGTNKYQINPLSPSIDKVNPSGIYEPSNVQYVCTWYNLAKGQMTEADLIKFCKRVADLY